MKKRTDDERIISLRYSLRTSCVQYRLVWVCSLPWARICKCLRSPGIDSASLCRLAARYVKQGCRKLVSIPGLLKRFKNSCSDVQTLLASKFFVLPCNTACSLWNVVPDNNKISSVWSISLSLKGLSHEIDFKIVDENGQILTLIRAAAGFWIFCRLLWFLVEIKHQFPGKC